MNLLDLVTGAWAIQPEKLLEIQAIYASHLRGEKIDLAAVEARLGRPLHSEQQAYTIAEGGVAVLRVSGVMAPKANLFMQVSGGMSTQMATKQLESATVDPRVRAIVLSMDTPGGAVLGTPEFAAAIHELAAIKPIVTHTDGVLASAGYWSGAAANAVFMSGSVNEIGSIGVVVNRTFNPNATVKEEHVVAGRYKRLAKAGEPLSEESRAVVQADVDYVYTLFVDDVAKYRGTTSEKVLDRMADGRVFRGQQAIDAGLVDGVSTLDALVEQMATNPDSFAKRRAAVFALGSVSPSTGAGDAPEDKTPQRDKGTSMSDPITRESFERDHASLFAQVRQEFTTAGAKQELDRIKGVRATTVPGHEALVETMAFDGKTTPAEAALAVNTAVRDAHAAAAKAHANDAPKPAAHSPAPPEKSAAKTKQEMTAEAQAYAKEHDVDFLTAFKKLGFDAS